MEIDLAAFVGALEQVSVSESDLAPLFTARAAVDDDPP